MRSWAVLALFALHINIQWARSVLAHMIPIKMSIAAQVQNNINNAGIVRMQSER